MSFGELKEELIEKISKKYENVRINRKIIN